MNPLCVLIFAPLCVWFFRWADPRGRIFTATNRMLLGFFMGILSSGLMWVAGALASGAFQSGQQGVVAEAQKISMFWPLAAYVLLTLAEVLIYGTGLELSYTAAPKSMKGFITGCFLVTVSIADLINDRVSQLYGGSLLDAPENRGRLSPAGFFALMTAIAVAAMIGFYFVGRGVGRQVPADDPLPVEKP